MKATPKKRLFLAMPFGIKSGSLDDLSRGKRATIDFDQVWKEIIKPSIPRRILVKRADELRTLGSIERDFLEWVFGADVLIADVTFGNPNVLYELGIRQALSSKSAILICQNGTRLPFDIRNQSVLMYDYFHAPSLRAFKKDLHGKIIKAAWQNPDPSPVHHHLPGLQIFRESATEPRAGGRTTGGYRRGRTIKGKRRVLLRIQEAKSSRELRRIYATLAGIDESGFRALQELGIKLRKHGLIDEAIAVFEKALTFRRDAPVILRELGFAYRKKGEKHYPLAVKHFERAILLGGKDVETVGMLGGLFKRMRQFRKALKCYAEAHQIDPTNAYALVNLGALSAVLGNLTKSRQYYRRLKEVCENAINRREADYWTYLCLAEAEAFGNDIEASYRALKLAQRGHAPKEDFASAIEQFEFLAKHHIGNGCFQKVLRRLAR